MTRGWAIVGVSLLFQSLTVGVLMSSTTLFVESWVAEFGVPRSRWMLALTLSAFTVPFLAPIAGRALDRLSIRLLICLGLSALALAALLLAHALHVTHVIAIYTALAPTAMLLCGTMPASLLAARWFPGNPGLAMGIVAVGTSMGGVLYPPIIHAIIASQGWRTAYEAAAAFSALVLLPLVIVVVRDNPPPDARHHAPAREGPTRPADAPSFDTWQILRTPAFWIINLCGAVIFAILAGTQANLAAYGAERGISLGKVAGLISLFAIALAGAKPIWGWLADRQPPRTLFLAAVSGCAAASLALAFAQGFFAVGFCFVLLGLVGGGLIPLQSAAFARLFGVAALGRAIGLSQTITVISAGGAPLIAFTHELWGSFQWVLIMVAAGAGAAALATFAFGHHLAADAPTKR